MRKVKILAIALIISAATAGFMASCSSDEPSVEQVKIVTLNKTVVSLLTGATETLTVSFSPNNEGADKAVTWTSSNASVATVSNGTITAVAKGETTVTVALTSNPAVKADATVTVTSAVESIALDKTELLIVIGDEEKLTATILPADADQTVTWTSSDAAIALVTSDGTVQAKTVGTATITATSVSDPTKKATSEVTVDDGKPDIPAPKVELALTAPSSTSVIEFLTGGETIDIITGPVSGVNALKFSAHAYAKINHGIAANGGGTRVNVYTLLIDFMVPTVEGYNSLYSVCDGSPELDRNSADGTVFLRADVDNSEWGVVGLGSAGGYSNLVGDYATTNSNCPELAAGLTDHLGERGAVKANTWYRLVLTYDLTSGRCAADGTSASQGVNRYLNGLQIHAGGYDKDSRLAMYPTGVLIHADNDGADEGGNPVPSTEVKETSIANIAIWDVKLTTGQVEALGKAGDPMKW